MTRLLDAIARLLPAGTEPDAGDAQLAAFAESIELAFVAVYDRALTDDKVTTPEAVEALTDFAMHHEAHAGAFAGIAAEDATGEPNPDLLDELTGQLDAAADEAAVLTVALGIENAAAATYLFALGALESTEALQLTASILPVESQHAVVLGTVLEKPPAEYVPSFETQDAALKPADYPLT